MHFVFSSIIVPQKLRKPQLLSDPSEAAEAVLNPRIFDRVTALQQRMTP
jgi:hypothetical protein